MQLLYFNALTLHLHAKVKESSFQLLILLQESCFVLAKYAVYQQVVSNMTSQ